MIDEEYDVIVTGAGPAGLSSALESAKNGAKTLILEKKQVIGEPTRTSGGTWIDYLESYPFSEKALGNHIRGFYFCPPSLKEVYFELNKIVGYVINVKAFYQELATMANKAAAKFSNEDWDSLISYTKKFNEYPEIGLRFIRSEFSIHDLFKISPKFALKLGFKTL